jgi:hypothetical protein
MLLCQPSPCLKGKSSLFYGFFSLCGCGGFRIATRLQLGAVAFCGCNVFQRLFSCGICVLLHTPYMAPC